MASLLLLIFVTVVLIHLLIPTSTSQTTTSKFYPLTTDPTILSSTAIDFGLMTKTEPIAVLHPTSSSDVSKIIKMSNEAPIPFAVSARGHGHSINGQAGASRGVVVEMIRRKHRENTTVPDSVTNTVGAAVDEPAHPLVNVSEKYVDVWGGEMWIDVLNATLQHGLAPKSWTDYLYLSVGGTLSNAGISGQAFDYGPQINNVHELDVVTGKGDIVTCSAEKNEELFHGVLGGLGQFGIITRARIALEPAPQRTRWIRVLYSNFTAFMKDQEHLISLQGKPSSEKFDYVEGFVIVDKGLINNWRSSFFSPQNPVKDSSLPASTVLYCLEVTKNYFDSTPSNVVDKEVEAILKKLEFIPWTVFTTDVGYVEFLDRVHTSELTLQAQGLWNQVPHPWLNLFVPKSAMVHFEKAVMHGVLGTNKTSGPILVYPMNRTKWDDRTSVALPKEEIFYVVSLLRTALENGTGNQKLDFLLNQNERILRFCKDNIIDVKQYLPHYTTQEEWATHFGNKWDRIRRLKHQYDPKQILATGQRIFQPSLAAFVPGGLAWL